MSWLPKTHTNSSAPRSTMRYHLLLTFFGLIMTLPFVWMVLTRLKPLAEVANENCHDVRPGKVYAPGGFALL